MTCADRLSVPNRKRDKLAVVAATANESWTRGFAKRDAEAKLGRTGGEGFVQIIDGLDEVRLAEDDVHVIWLLDRNDLDVHDFPPTSCTFGPAERHACPLQLVRQPQMVLFENSGDTVRYRVNRGLVALHVHGPEKLLLEPGPQLFFRQPEHQLAVGATGHDSSFLPSHLPT